MILYQQLAYMRAIFRLHPAVWIPSYKITRQRSLVVCIEDWHVLGKHVGGMWVACGDIKVTCGQFPPLYGQTRTRVTTQVTNERNCDLRVLNLQPA